jgi:hypothetical protein
MIRVGVDCCLSHRCFALALLLAASTFSALGQPRSPGPREGMSQRTSQCITGAWSSLLDESNMASRPRNTSTGHSRRISNSTDRYIIPFRTECWPPATPNRRRPLLAGPMVEYDHRSHVTILPHCRRSLTSVSCGKLLFKYRPIICLIADYAKLVRQVRSNQPTDRIQIEKVSFSSRTEQFRGLRQVILLPVFLMCRTAFCNGQGCG